MIIRYARRKSAEAGDRESDRKRGSITISRVTNDTRGEITHSHETTSGRGVGFNSLLLSHEERPHTHAARHERHDVLFAVVGQGRQRLATGDHQATCVFADCAISRLMKQVLLELVVAVGDHRMQLAP